MKRNICSFCAHALPSSTTEHGRYPVDQQRQPGLAAIFGQSAKETDLTLGMFLAASQEVKLATDFFSYREPIDNERYEVQTPDQTGLLRSRAAGLLEPLFLHRSLENVKRGSASRHGELNKGRCVLVGFPICKSPDIRHPPQRATRVSPAQLSNRSLSAKARLVSREG